MLHLLLASQAGTAEAAFDEGLRQARLTRLMSDKEFARAFALAYVGIDRESVGITWPAAETVMPSRLSPPFAGSASRRQGDVATELPQSERH